jgi:hypothetical protein
MVFSNSPCRETPNNAVSTKNREKNGIGFLSNLFSTGILFYIYIFCVCGIFELPLSLPRRLESRSKMHNALNKKIPEKLVGGWVLVLGDAWVLGRGALKKKVDGPRRIFD